MDKIQIKSEVQQIHPKYTTVGGPKMERVLNVSPI